MNDKMKLDERQTDEEILAQYPSDKMKQAVASKLTKEKKNTSSNVLHVSFGSTTVQRILSAAAIIAVAVVIPVTVSQTKYGQQAVRAKGTSSTSGAEEKLNSTQKLVIYRDENGKAVSLKNKSKANKGDVIQLSYTVPNAAYGMILSIDGEGTVTRHLPENGDEAVLLSSAGTEVPLPNAYKLDDAHYFERFVLITSNTPFSSSNVELAVSAMKRNHAKSASLKKYFPKDAVISSVILLKQDEK